MAIAWVAGRSLQGGEEEIPQGEGGDMMTPCPLFVAQAREGWGPGRDERCGRARLLHWVLEAGGWLPELVGRALSW